MSALTKDYPAKKGALKTAAAHLKGDGNTITSGTLAFTKEGQQIGYLTGAKKGNGLEMKPDGIHRLIEVNASEVYVKVK